jgi:flavin reductase
VDALVSFDCRINQIVSVGTHDILFCEVAAIVRHPEPRGLMWFDRGYHTLMRPAC